MYSMALERADREREAGPGTIGAFEPNWAWKGGALAGLVATIVMGVVITLTNLETLRLAIAGLYGFEGSLAVGWVAHLVHGTIFGVLFAALLSDPGLYGVSERVWKTVGVGVVYGLVLAVVGAGIVMPIWLDVAGFPTPPSIPNVTGPTLLWHVVYGAVLGGVFPFVTER